MPMFNFFERHFGKPEGMASSSEVSSLPRGADSPAFKKVSTVLYAYFVTIAASIAGFALGYQAGLLNQIMEMPDFQDSFLSDLPESPISQFMVELRGWVIFAFLMGGLAGAMLGLTLADRISRRWSLLVGSMVFCAGSAIQASASNIFVLIFGRFVSGVSSGIMTMVAPLYIAEVADTPLRGEMMALFTVACKLGSVCANIANSVLIEYFNGALQWRLAIGFQLLSPIALFVLMLILPHSPCWLVMMDADDEAIATLAILRSKDRDSEEVQREYLEIRSAVERERNAYMGWEGMKRPSNLSKIFIACSLQGLSQLSGSNFLRYYASELFMKIGFTQSHSTTSFVILLSLTALIFTLPAVIMIRYVGRKSLLLRGSIILAVIQFSICLVVGLSQSSPNLSWMAIALIFIFFAVYSPTWGVVVWLFQSEIFPLTQRARGTSFATMTYFLVNGIVSKESLIVFHGIDYWIYGIFGIMCIIMAIFVYVFVPETRGLSFEEIDRAFGVSEESNSVSESVPFYHGYTIASPSAYDLEAERLWKLEMSTTTGAKRAVDSILFPGVPRGLSGAPRTFDFLHPAI